MSRRRVHTATPLALLALPLLALLLLAFLLPGLPDPVHAQRQPTIVPPRLPPPLPFPTPLPTPLPTPPPTPPPTPTPAVRPNIVLILADDLDAASFDTGALDQVQSMIGGQGASFPNFLLSQSLCCPSRASILLGQYVHNHQIYSNKPTNNPNHDGGFQKFYKNGQGLEPSTVATWLRALGYRTGLFGKYLNGYPNSVAIQPERYVPPGWDTWFVNVGQLPNADPADFPYYNYRANYRPNADVNAMVLPFGHTDADYNTDQIGLRAVDFIRQAASAGKPFFAYLAPHAPHLPAVAPPRHRNEFDGLQVPRDGSFNEDVRDKPTFVRNLPSLTSPPDPDQTGELDRIYRRRLRSLRAVNDLVPQVIAELQANGQLANTYIFFVSDNGFHLGQHRLGPGKTTAYEEDIRVPMAVRGPGIAPGAVVQDLVGNIDLAPTFLHIASLQADEQPPMPPVATNQRFADGRSLLPLMHGRLVAEPNRRKSFLIEHFPNAVNLTIPPDALVDDDLTGVPFDAPNLPAFLGLRTQSHTFVLYKKDNQQELYDLANDPFQLCNLMRRDKCESLPPAPDPNLVPTFLSRLAELQTCCQGSGCTQRCSDIENRSLTTAPPPPPGPTPTPLPTPTPTPTPSPSPRLNVTPPSLAFNLAAGATGTSGLQLSGSGTPPPAQFTLSKSATATWLSLSPTAGALPAAVTVTAQAGSLAPGTYNASITATAAATNSPVSVPVTLTVTGGGGGGGGGALANGGFESGPAPWQFADEASYRSGDGNARSGAAYAELALSFVGGQVTQDFTVPCTANSLSLQLAVTTRITSTLALDKLFVEFTNPSNQLLQIFGTYSNLDQGAYQLRGPFDLSPFRCQTVRLRFRGSPNTSFGGATTFRVDDVAVQ